MSDATHPLASAAPPPATTDRRTFLKQGAAAAGFFIVPRFVLGGPGYTAPSDQLVIAGIGVGGKGESDLLNFYKSGKARIAYLCDVDRQRAAGAVKAFPQAKFYEDWRQLLDKEARHIDAVSIATPDHNHAAPTLAAMQLGKHVYVQKPLTHDIYEARALTEAARQYKVVTQMGNQGASGDGVRQLRDWHEAGLIGDVHTVYCWTDRPVWPQGIAWPATPAPVPATLNWDLWLGTAPLTSFVEKLVPFNWRGWWEYGTGALGDMGCHLVEAPFRVLDLQYPRTVQASVGSVYVDEFKRGYFPASCPPSSHVTLVFPKTAKTSQDVTLHWMDGGIQPTRPSELGPLELFGDGGNGILFEGTKGKMMASTYAANPRLLPTSLTTTVPQTLPRVPGGAEGHYAQWVEACRAGYGKMPVSAPFEVAGPLTEALLIANLAVRGYDVRRPKTGGGPTDYAYPGRNVELLWDPQQLRVTNWDEANQFVRRDYRAGWKMGL